MIGHSPNLWITGLPKAGTSSLFSSLELHPQIVGSTPKETFFLLDQDSILLNRQHNYWSDGAAGWARFLKANNGSIRYYLEGTTHLFYQKSSIDVLKKDHPASRFIIMLREPAERIYSSFVFTRDTLVRMPPEISFHRYVKDLLSGSSLPYVTDPVSRYVLSRELAFSNYADHLQRWRSSFDSSQIFTGLFEDYISDHSSFMRRIYHFLDLESPGANPTHRNPTLAFKRPMLHRALILAARYLPADIPLKKTLKQVYMKAFSHAPTPASDEDLEAKHQLRKYFRQINERLTSDFGIDVSRWNEQ